MSNQLDMFGADDAAASGSRKAGIGLAKLPPQIHELGARLPAHLRMGTSSWSFTGWTNLVWDRAASQRTIARHGLATYARHPLFRTVGLDRTYYAPMRTEQLADMGAGLPEGFQLLVKAHAECTTVKFSERSWHRGRAGQRNERFLEPEYATETVVRPFMDGLGRHGGILLFQFPAQQVPGGPKSFAHRLGQFLEALPRGPQYAVEIRNPDLLTPRYVSALERVGATHCVAELPGMPPVHKQWEVSGGNQRPALVMRWMLARHHNYESARDTYAPFDALVDEHPGVRLAYAKMIASSSKPAFMIINNKAEGCSPLSVQRLAEQLMVL